MTPFEINIVILNQQRGTVDKVRNFHLQINICDKKVTTMALSMKLTAKIQRTPTNHDVTFLN